MELAVEIQKRMKGFKLEVAFRAGLRTLGVLGPSGSGKSMTLRCVAGLEMPDRGRIVLNGRTLFDSDRGINLPSRKRRVGFLLQDYALFPHMTLEENIAFGLHSIPPAEARKRVKEQIARVQLNGLENRRPRQLSGGQQQRAALARALAVEPEVLLLDEPLSALDVHLRSQMETLLVETLAAFQGVSLYVTHNLEEAYRIAEEIVVISNGQEIALGPKESIFRHPPNYSTAQVTGCKNFSRARSALPERVEALDWGCRLRICPSPAFEWVAIRAHHITLATNGEAENTVPCRLARAIEGPFRMTLYLEVLLPNTPAAHHHLQAEITKETWDGLKNHAFPWYARLAPDKLMVF
ncbi:MAG: sulfate/molybdate ABC transporter ATP-binding protein [Terriglobia bacterium]